MIGRPGQGKTPPLDYAYRPLQEHDFLQVSRYIEENKRYAEHNAGVRDGDAYDTNKPVLIQTILSDLTQEAMMRIHNDNQRDIVEISGKTRNKVAGPIASRFAESSEKTGAFFAF